MNTPPNSAEAGRILVIRGGALGDFILTLPVLAALRRQFPGVQLELLAYPQFAVLALEGRLADQIHPIESRPLAGFFARNGVLDPGLSDFFARFHVVFSYLYDPDEIFRNNLARVTRAQVIQGPHRPNESSPQHAAEQLLVPLERLGIFDADSRPALIRTKHSVRQNCLVVHPGSGSESKNWPEAAWMAFLSAWLQTDHRSVLLVGGESEGDRLARLASELPSDRLQIARSLPLGTLAARMSSCLGFIGHDSGISHLAAASGLPGLVLWGPSNPVVWRPASSQVELLIATHGLSQLTVQTVLKRLESLWTQWALAENSGAPNA